MVTCCFAVDVPVIALSLPQRTLATTTATITTADVDTGVMGYTALSNALGSVIRLAVEDVNAEGTLLESGYNLTVTVLEQTTLAGTVQTVCNLITTSGNIYGVIGPFLSSQAALLESLANDHLALPIVAPSAAAARAVNPSVRDVGGKADRSSDWSYLVGVQPDIFQQMQAMATLILNMKATRDSARGWSYSSERVFVVHTDDLYGLAATRAFVRAAQDSTGVNLGGLDEEPSLTTIELVATETISANAGSDFRPSLKALLDRGASIIVLLAEGHDGSLVREVFRQAQEIGLVTEGVQWYLPDAAAMDGIFAINETDRDSTLAYDLRGTLGVRPCSPIVGSGSKEIARLTSAWPLLDSEAYPGAGAGTLTADGRLDPWLAFAYDSVFVLAAAIGEAQAADASSFKGLSANSCPFPTGSNWPSGGSIRDAALGTKFVGVTGPFQASVQQSISTNGGEAVLSGWRATEGTNFCAVNLRADAFGDAAFMTTMTWSPASTNAASGFQVINSSQNQTFPSGSETYPSDRPTLRGMHLQVVTQAVAKPFVLVPETYSGNQSNVPQEDVEGIAILFLQALSLRLGFTYTLTVRNDMTKTNDVVESVADGTFDVSASWTTITAERSEYVSFSYPYFDVGIAFIYKPNAISKLDFWKVFTPFEPGLWLAILFALLTTVTLLWVFEGAKNDQFAVRTGTSLMRYQRSIRTGMWQSVYVTVSLLLGQLTHKPETLEGYILTSGWIFTCFILAASFTAELASFLIVQRESSLTMTVDDLRSGTAPHSQVALLQGGNLQAFYERDIMQCTGTGCVSGVVPQLCSTLDECFSMVMKGQAAMTIMDSATSEYEVVTEYCGLAILPETVNPQHYGLVLPKDSPFLEELGKATLGLREDGSIAGFGEKYFDTSTCKTGGAEAGDSTYNKNLSAMDLAGVFLVLLLFFGASLMLWLCRRSSTSKRIRRHYSARRGRLSTKDYDEDESKTGEQGFPKDFERMSRKHRKMVAFEAVVHLLSDAQKRERELLDNREEAVDDDALQQNTTGENATRIERGSMPSHSSRRLRTNTRIAGDESDSHRTL